MNWIFVCITLGARAIDGILAAPRLFLGSDGRLQWETLATGVAAVCVAWHTILKLSEEIRQTEDLATDQRQRRARAARAILPLALTEIGEYSTACIRAPHALRPCFRDDGALLPRQVHTPLEAWSTPRLPESVLPLLRECIEFCDDPPATALYEMVRHFQVQYLVLAQDVSRLRGNDGVHILLWANVESSILLAAELYARAAALFPFSRGETTEVCGVGRLGIYNACTFAGCFMNLRDIDDLADRWQRERDHPFPRPDRDA